MAAQQPPQPQRAPGQKNPGKYPFTGPNYATYGEQAGYIYYPWQDKYYIDPNAAKDYYQQQGIVDKDPSYMETIAPVVGSAAALGVGQAAGQSLGGMFGSGAATAGTGATAATTGAGTAAAGGTAAGSAAAPTGLMGAGSAGTAGAASTGAAAGSGTAASGAGASGGAAAGGSSGVGAGTAAGAAAIGALWLNNLYEEGGKEIASGDANSEDWTNNAVAHSTMWWLQPMMRAFGMKSIGRGLFGNTTAVEGDRLKGIRKQLEERGAVVPDYLKDENLQDVKTSREEQLKTSDLPPDFVGFTNDGRWVNNKWLQSGNVKDLTDIDLQGYSEFVAKDPYDMENRKKEAAKALAAGAVSEGKGTITVDWEKVAKFEKENPDWNYTATQTKPSDPKLTGMMGNLDSKAPGSTGTPTAQNQAVLNSTQGKPENLKGLMGNTIKRTDGSLVNPGDKDYQYWLVRQ